MSIVKYRSRYAAYQVGPDGKTLKFSGHMAQTSDQAVIEAVEKSPSFGPGLDFWRDDPALASVAAPPKPAPTETMTTETAAVKTGETTETPPATEKKPGGKK